jgi:hypothetical protein|tara:strand:+ start:1648 stop:1827 length:180 start_codon:yes stop_codon:yes gene_type:complete
MMKLSWIIKVDSKGRTVAQSLSMKDQQGGLFGMLVNEAQLSWLIASGDRVLDDRVEVTA